MARSALLQGLLLTLILLSGCTGQATDPDTGLQLPDLATIEKLEARIAMPSGASLITDYARCYTAEMHGERPVVVGAMFDGSTAHVESGVSIVPKKHLPLVADGGCPIITV